MVLNEICTYSLLLFTIDRRETRKLSYFYRNVIANVQFWNRTGNLLVRFRSFAMLPQSPRGYKFPGGFVGCLVVVVNLRVSQGVPGGQGIYYSEFVSEINLEEG